MISRSGRGPKETLDRGPVGSPTLGATGRGGFLWYRRTYPTREARSSQLPKGPRPLSSGNPVCTPAWAPRLRRGRLARALSFWIAGRSRHRDLARLGAQSPLFPGADLGVTRVAHCALPISGLAPQAAKATAEQGGCYRSPDKGYSLGVMGFWEVGGGMLPSLKKCNLGEWP